jgi:two-component sensor histidine kinase/CheY-like chemotaxis protein
VDRITLPDGSFGVVCYFRDMAAEVEAENTRQFLVRELNHRVKNTLASVQAIAQQTMRVTNEPGEFARRFSGRIQSLARVHALLTESTWQGADLRELVRDQLLHGPVDETRLTAWGPVVHLQPQMALHLAVMLHELGTNSIKYGALSAPKGWVAINWTVMGDVLNLQWVERGGPTVSTPSRRGFGTTLIEHSAKSEGGKAEQLIEPEGLTWKISMKLPEGDTRPRSDANEPTLVRPSPAQSPAHVAKPEAPLADRRFLVVEDESLIALDLVDTLERLGADEARCVSTEQEACVLLEKDTFDYALLDANLHGRSVENIAAALTRRSIPFVFVTGYGRAGLPAGFGQAPVLAKPVSDEQLLEAVTTLAPKSRKVVHGDRVGFKLIAPSR